MHTYNGEFTCSLKCIILVVLRKSQPLVPKETENHRSQKNGIAGLPVFYLIEPTGRRSHEYLK